MFIYILSKRFVVFGACLLYLIFGSITPGVALGCEGGGEEHEELVDKGQKWRVLSPTFHEVPKIDEKQNVTIELISGGPEKLTSINVGQPANFKINKRNGCEKEYKNGDFCSIEMEFLTAGKAKGEYFANLELSFEKEPKLTFTKVPKGTIP